MTTINTGKSVEIFTDGACSGNPGPGGWGVILRWGGQERELSGDDTLESYIAREQRKYPKSRGVFADLLRRVGLATKVVVSKVGKAGLLDVLGQQGSENVQASREDPDLSGPTKDGRAQASWAFTPSAFSIARFLSSLLTARI